MSKIRTIKENTAVEKVKLWTRFNANAKMIQNSMKSLASEIEFKENGMIQKRAQTVLDEALVLLQKIAKDGMFSSLENGVFAETKRPINGGKGLHGVFEKSENYINVVSDRLEGSFNEN